MEQLLSLDWMAQGKLQEKFQNALNQVLMNIVDPAYEAKAKRQIVITFKLTVAENRGNADLSAEVRVKLPTEGPAIAAILIGKSKGEWWATERATPLLPLEPMPGPALLEVDSSLSTFASGTLNARFEDAFRELLANAADYNTPARASRKIVATITFEPNSARTHAGAAIDVATTLAKPHQLETTLLIGEPIDEAETASLFGQSEAALSAAASDY